MTTLHFPVNPCSVPSCADCSFLDECGGLEGDDYSKGCFRRCDSHCKEHGCDSVCPSIPLVFAELFEDVGGICLPPRSRLCEFCETSLPAYIPQINHGGGRYARLEEDWVTVPLYEIAGRDRMGRYTVRFDSPTSMREALHLAPKTHVLVTSVGLDRYIEDFWENHVKLDIIGRIAQLGVSGMTVPNYSFMLDVPRTNSLYNLSRIFRMAERISEGGIPTVLHLNASTKRDWQRWRDVLREQHHMDCLCVEFQTGAGRREIGDKYVSGLVQLQQDLGRKLHPIALAGGARLADFRKYFSGSFTIVDSTPFFKTMNRQVLVCYQKTSWKWRKLETAIGEPLDRYLQNNIDTHRNRILERIGRAADTEVMLPNPSTLAA